MWLVCEFDNERHNYFITANDYIRELMQGIRMRFSGYDSDGDSYGPESHHIFQIILKSQKDEIVLYRGYEENGEYCDRWSHPTNDEKGKLERAKRPEIELRWMKNLCKVERWIMEAINSGKDIIIINSNEITKQLNGTEFNPILKDCE